jgi:hypothetical protein
LQSANVSVAFAAQAVPQLPAEQVATSLRIGAGVGQAAAVPHWPFEAHV